MSNYYGCTAAHNEHHCLSAYYHVKKFRKEAAWCDNCRERFIFPA